MPDSMPVADLPDPRVWPDPADADAASAQLHVAVAEAIDAGTGREAAIADARALRQIERLLAANAGRALADAFATAPSFAVARHLWRLLAAVERGEPQRTTALTTTLFALPVVMVAALDAGDEALTLSGILPDPRALEALLRDCRVDNVGFRAGLHGDVDPLTGAPLLFKEATARPAAPLH